MQASVEFLVREVFQDVRKSFGTQRNGSEVRSEWIQKHESAMKEIEILEKSIGDVDGELLGGLKRIDEDEPEESTKTTKRSLTSSLEPELARKYALIKSEDLFTEIYISEDSVATSEQARERWKEEQPAARESVTSKPKTVHKRIRHHLSKITKPRSDEVLNALNDRSLNREKLQKSIIRSGDHRTILVARPTRVEFVNFERREIYKIVACTVKGKVSSEAKIISASDENFLFIVHACKTLKVVVIKNVSNSVAKYQLETRSPTSKFSVVLQSRSGDRENLAPGIDARMIVTFRSEDLEDCEERFVVKVESGKPVVVVARAYRDPPILKGVCLEITSDYIKARRFDSGDNSSLIGTCGSCENSSDDYWDEFDVVSSDSSESNYVSALKESSPVRGSLSCAHFDCKKCFVGERKVVATRLTNTGGDGRFFVMSEIDWNSMNIDDITTKNLIVFTCFAVWPTYFSLKRDEEIELLTYFFPDSRGVQVDKLYIVCDNLAVQPVELIGDGVTFDRGIITIGENADTESTSFEERREDVCEYVIDLGVAISNDYLRSTLTITNTSGMEIWYRWEKRSTNDRERRNAFRNWNDLPLDLFGVRPSSGVFRPCSATIFKIFARTTNLSGESCRAILQLIIEDIPEAAIDDEYQDRAEICTNKRRFCERSMDLRAKEIEVRIRSRESLGLQTLTSSNTYNIDPINEREEDEVEEEVEDNIQRHSSKFPVHKSISA